MVCIPLSCLIDSFHTRIKIEPTIRTEKNIRQVHNIITIRSAKLSQVLPTLMHYHITQHRKSIILKFNIRVGPNDDKISRTERPITTEFTWITHSMAAFDHPHDHKKCKITEKDANIWRVGTRKEVPAEVGGEGLAQVLSLYKFTDKDWLFPSVHPICTYTKAEGKN